MKHNQFSFKMKRMLPYIFFILHINESNAQLCQGNLF